MSWNYRVVRYHSGDGYGLHEVYYDNNGLEWGMTKEPAVFVCGPDEGVEGIRGSLMKAKLDAQKRPILDEPDIWPGKNPADALAKCLNAIEGEG